MRLGSAMVAVVGLTLGCGGADGVASDSGVGTDGRRSPDGGSSADASMEPMAFSPVDSDTGFGILTLSGVDADHVWGVTASSAFAFGQIIALEEGSWTQVSSSGGFNPVRSVYAAGIDDVWAVTGDSGPSINSRVIMHTDGEGWTSSSSPGDGHYQDIHGTSSSDMWLLNANGEVSRYDGSEWTLSTTFPFVGSQWISVFALSSNNAWALALNGRVQHWDGTSWSSLEDLPSGSYYDLWAAGANSVYAVSADGSIYHFADNQWTAMTSGTDNTLNSVWGQSDSDVWAVGAEGTILHYDGTLWRSADSSTSANLLSVWSSSLTDVWVGGADGIMLRLDTN